MLINTWKLTESEAAPEDIRTRESLMAQGNGYIGWRGTFEEGIDGSLKGTYINGFYETYPIKYPESAYGFASEGQTMLNVLNAMSIKIFVDSELINMNIGGISGYRRELDFRNGLLRREVIFTGQTGKKLKVVWERLLSFAMPHCGVIRCSLKPINFSGLVEVVSGIDTDTHNLRAEDDPRVGTHLPEDCFCNRTFDADGGKLYAAQETRRSGCSIACAVIHEVSLAADHSKDKAGLSETRGFGGVDAVNDIREKWLDSRFLVPVTQGKTVCFTKWIAYDTARQKIAPELLRKQAVGYCAVAQQTGYQAMKAIQKAYLDDYWYRTDIEIGGDEKLQQGLRFNAFHILQSVGRDGQTNIAAKGLTGEGYEGHYFWDTETFVIPYLLYSNPDICRKLLEHRYGLLDSARRLARGMAHERGALFPWRTIGGGECSPYFPAGTAQYHINADIAVAVKKYVQATGDDDFLLHYGAEIVFETARFYADLGHFSEGEEVRFCIDCVTGPDEYTAIVNNNFYTNLMARENLWYAAEVFELLGREHPKELQQLTDKLSLASGEPGTWQRAGDLMYLPYDEAYQINLQDDSFMQKAEWDFAHTPKEKYPLLLNFHPLVLYRHKVLKQADTVLADFILDKYMTKEQIRRDYEYYEVRTTHDSSLSSCIYGIVACQIGKLEDAYRHFGISARGDLDNRKGNTRDGVHIANMAGTGMCIINGFAGVRQRDEQLYLEPQKPAHWEFYRFRLRFRGRLMEVLVGDKIVTVRLLAGDPMALFVSGEEHWLTEAAPVAKPYVMKAEVIS